MHGVTSRPQLTSHRFQGQAEHARGNGQDAVRAHRGTTFGYGSVHRLDVTMVDIGDLPRSQPGENFLFDDPPVVMG